MAVQRAGVGYKAQRIAGGSASGSVTANLSVDPTAVDKFGIVFIGWVGEVDTTSATFTPTWNGHAMTPLSAAVRFDSNKSMQRGWIIDLDADDPTGGATAVVAAYSGVTTGLLAKFMYVDALAISGVEDDLATIIASVVTAVGSGSVASGGVTVTSDVAADRVYSSHLVGKARTVKQFTGTRVAAPTLTGAGQLMLGESRGAVSVPATATFNANTNQWSAIGFNANAAPIDALGFAGSVSVAPGAFGADLYRFATPHPDRDYLVPPLGSGDPLVVADDSIRLANGVDMRVWVKDPDDLLDYTLRWYNHLGPNDEIVRVEHTPSPSIRLISEGVNPEDAGMTQMWIKGAIRGATLPIRIRLWTKLGRQMDFTTFVAGADN